MPLLALAAATLFVVCSYGPVLAPLIDRSLVFISSDLTTIAGSATQRADMARFVLVSGVVAFDTLRFFVLASTASIAQIIPFSDSQFHSALILISIIIGSAGIYLAVTRFVEDGRIAAALIAILVPFYFLNPWSTERLVHIWIWFTYAILPMQLALGLMHIRSKSPAVLGGYSLLISAFGPIPHSLIYESIVHAAVIGYAAASRVDRRTLVIFALVPVAIYALINAPFLYMLVSLFSEKGVSYPADISERMLGGLSAHGKLPDLFAFSNNWYPPSRIQDISKTPVFTVSSFSIFVIVLSLFSIAYGRMTKDQKAVSLISMGAILVSIFIAQGMNNPILGYFVDAVSDSGLGVLIGPFREWARISIMIPVFMLVIISVSIRASDKPLQAFIALGIVVVANIAVSPSWNLLGQKYAPVSIDDTYYRLASVVPSDARIVWMDDPDGIPVVRLNGTQDALRALPFTFSIGSPYTSSGFRVGALTENMTLQKMRQLGVSYMVLDDDAKVRYPSFECEQVGFYKLCSEGGTASRFWVDADGAPDRPARVAGYSRQDPTRWDVSVDASSQFMLSFAEYYRSGWVARVYKNVVLVSESDPTKREGGIIGFQIKDTGELDIRVVFAPQETYESLLWVSGLGVLACVAMACGVGRR
jgi:hypothetical protein